MGWLDDALFHGARWVHILAGVFAALVLFPLQMFGAPGGPRHRARRRLVTITAWVIAIAGGSMLVNPQFSGFWKEQSNRLGYATFFETQDYKPLFFVFLDVILLYLILTGVNVWRRDRGVGERAGPPRPLDVVLALLLLACCGWAIFIGLYDWKDGFTWTRPFVAVGILLAVIVLWDVSTWRPGFRSRPHTWLRHHTMRLVVAWGGLFYAVELRFRIRFHEMSARSHEIDLGWLVLVAVALLIGNVRFRRTAHRSTASAPPA